MPMKQMYLKVNVGCIPQYETARFLVTNLQWRRFGFRRARELGCDTSHPISIHKRFYRLTATRLAYRNVVKNTLADTPSGYIQDPANHPRQMITYDRITSESPNELFEAEYLDELMNRDELMYKGYTTMDIQKLKAIVLDKTSSEVALESACSDLQNILKDMINNVGSIVKQEFHYLRTNSTSTEMQGANTGLLSKEHLLSVEDCNHVRYIIALAKRRLGDFEGAEQTSVDILSTDHGNCDALECLLEIYTGTEEHDKIRLLLDQLLKWDQSEKKDGSRLALGNDSSHKDMKPDQSMLVELALVLLSDMIVEAAASHYTIHKEGSTTRYFYEIIYPLVNSLRPLYASMLLFCLFRCLDEHHIASRLKNTAIKESECAIGLVISFLKMLLARRMYEIVEEPILFKFQILSKLHAALCFSDRKHESYSICEQLIAQYRCISQKYCSSSESRIENRELLDSVEPVYKAALFQYVEDRSNDSLSTGRRLCVQAIEEYPQEAHPWETLALVLHKEDPANNLDDAIVAAKKAFSLNPVNPRVILMLANFYKAQKRYNLYEELLERYRALSTLLENGAKEDEINRMINGIDDLDKTYQPEEEPDQVKLQSAPMREYMNRMEIAHAYSMPIDKEPRVFGEQPVTVPILDPSIISEKGG